MRAERQIVFWLTAAVLLILTIALLKDILLPFIVGITIAYFLSPIVDRLSSWGVNRIVASLLIVAAGAVLLVAALFLLVPLISTQAQQFGIHTARRVATGCRPSSRRGCRDGLGPHSPVSRR